MVYGCVLTRNNSRKSARVQIVTRKKPNDEIAMHGCRNDICRGRYGIVMWVLLDKRRKMVTVTRILTASIVLTCCFLDIGSRLVAM